MVSAQEQSKAVRSAGILLHPTSLPGRYGIGDLGPAAYAWIDALAAARQKWWQILPLGPTGFGDSPYQCFSAFAGNPYLVSPDSLLADGLLDQADLEGVSFPDDHVDYGPVIEFKLGLLAKAWGNFEGDRASALRKPFEEFKKWNAHWIDDYALFMALKEHHGGAAWNNWPGELVRREPAALAAARSELAGTVGRHQFGQFLFFRQWGQLKDYAHKKGIQLIGDIPIFVSSDSSDVWANHEIFQLDGQRRPAVVAGVPPDYFSATGQLWGNPLYNWEALRQTDYAWWVARVRACLEQVDLVRLDHFRGFESYWEVPAGMPSAEVGRWAKGPGTELFQVLQEKLGRLPLIAEDLGLITEEVGELRDALNLPGMRILHFAFYGDPDDRYLPHNYERNTVVYTGTHDNDTTVGWLATLPEKDRAFLRRYVPHADHDIAGELIRTAWASVADYAIAPLQDLLRLGTQSRMNMPGRAAGNWAWRLLPNQLTPELLAWLADITEVYGRA